MGISFIFYFIIFFGAILVLKVEEEMVGGLVLLVI